MKEHQATAQYASYRDETDPLRAYRGFFNYPPLKSGKTCIYFCGNSLGLQPVGVRDHIEKELKRWQMLGVDGWFDGDDPWIKYAESLAPAMARIVGAEPDELTIMNSLTVNLHLLMAGFYKPEGNRTRILMESDAFPSDRYALQAQINWHGLKPDEELLVVEAGEDSLVSTERVKNILEEQGEEIAMVLLGGVNYYTGQLFDIEEITALAHEKGCRVGWDLAHAAGNVPLSLHDWGVDFAAWCNYKYLNSGPGSVASAFVHSKHHENSEITRLSGWWGQDIRTRFDMRQPWDPSAGAAGWKVSTPTILALACVRASLELFDKAGMQAIREKSVDLTGYLEFLLEQTTTDRFEVITPSDPKKRGAQLSVRVKGADKSLFDALSDHGIILDWREPDVIRVAPAPLYNTFSEVFEFSQILASLVR